MKKTAVIFIVFMIHIAKINVSAQEKTDFAAGIIIGEPTGISLKYENLAASISWR